MSAFLSRFSRFSVLSACATVLVLIAILAITQNRPSHRQFHFSAECSEAVLTRSDDGARIVFREIGGPGQTLPYSAAGTLTVVGNALDNTLTVDFSHGDPIPEGGLSYHGLSEATETGDTLVMIGQGSRSTDYQPINEKDGILRLRKREEDTGFDSFIAFTGLEPILDTVYSSSLTVNGTAGANSISIVQGSFDAAQNEVAVDSFETIEFTNKNGLTVNADGGNDMIVADFATAASSLTTLTVNGGEADDTFDLRSAPVNTTLSGVEFVEVGGANPGAGTIQDFDLAQATLRIDIQGTAPGTGYDQITATSIDVTDAILTIEIGIVPEEGTEFVIVETDSGVTGTFLGLPEGALLPVGLNGKPASISYMGGDGNDIVLTVLGVQADVRIGRRSNPARQKGDGVYNRSATGQTDRLLLRGNRNIGVYFFSVERDGGVPGELILFGSGSRRNSTVTYQQILPSRANITTDFIRSFYLLDLPSPGDLATFRARVKVNSKRINRNFRVIAMAPDATRKQDRAAFRIRKR